MSINDWIRWGEYPTDPVPTPEPRTWEVLDTLGGVNTVTAHDCEVVGDVLRFTNSVEGMWYRKRDGQPWCPEFRHIEVISFSLHNVIRWGEK